MAETRAVSVNTLLASAAKNDVLRQLLILVGIAASVAVGVAAVMWSQGSDYRTLYSSLPAERASAVVDALNASQIPYRIQESTGSIMVPAEQLHDARIRLAGQGLERDGSGMAMLEQEQGFGVSEFMQSKKYHYALEQELASTIESPAAGPPRPRAFGDSQAVRICTGSQALKCVDYAGHLPGTGCVETERLGNR